MIAHSIEPVAEKPATCKEEGYEAHFKCSECDKLFSDADGQNEIETPVVIAKTDHSWNNGEVTTQPTCTAEGVETFTCTVCGETKTEKIDMIAHSIEPVAEKPATFEEDGYKAHFKCSKCGKLFSDENGETEISSPEPIQSLGAELSERAAAADTAKDAAEKAAKDAAEAAQTAADAARKAQNAATAAPSTENVNTAETANNEAQAAAKNAATKATEAQTLAENAAAAAQAVQETANKIVADTTATEEQKTVANNTATTASSNAADAANAANAAKQSSTAAATSASEAKEAADTAKANKAKADAEARARADAEARARADAEARARAAQPTEIVDLPAVKIKSAKKAKAAFTAKWKKVSKKNRKKIGGIEIQYSRVRDFSSSVTTRTAKKTKTSLKIKKLPRKTTYYVRVRAYKWVGNVKHVSKWSGTKTVKTK